MRVFREHLTIFVGVLLSLFFFFFFFVVFCFEGGMWDLIVLIPNHCLSIYFGILNLCSCECRYIPFLLQNLYVKLI